MQLVIIENSKEMGPNFETKNESNDVSCWETKWIYWLCTCTDNLVTSFLYKFAENFNTLYIALSSNSDRYFYQSNHF